MWPRYPLGPRTLYPRVWHPLVVIMGPRHPLPPSLLVPTASPAPEKPCSKDLRYDGKSSWIAFLHKLVRLARSEQWTEVEQHDQFCFALEGMASEYYTLLLVTDPGVHLRKLGHQSRT